ncbi:MAG: right-handed parallel beta-helix repeat-containing protein [Candidatus Zixiibacteriota bacterium]|nr:MAG: right-handed parallel beta-helix repeat-containing protein [candidate division Zixibacteria bacterium]
MKRIIFIIAAYIMFISAFCWGTIINVPQDYPTVQTGINASTNGDTVLVQPGTYVENINFNGHNIVLGSLFLTTGDTIYISQTIIDGDSAGTVVLFENGEGNTAIITGFTIRNGWVSTSFYGGGITCRYQSHPKIIRNIITENSSYVDGAGITCAYESNPEITHNIITGNNSNFDGGGIFCRNSSPVINGNTINGNFAGRLGGGIRCMLNSNPQITGNIISANAASNNGGGIYSNSDSLLVNGNTIINNSAKSGGGIYCMYCEPLIINNTIINNSALNSEFAAGGGIYCHRSNAIISDNVISSNIAEDFGGGIYCGSDDSSTISGNTISENSSRKGGGLYLTNSSDPDVANNTISGNNASATGGGIFCGYLSDPLILNNVITDNVAQGEGGGGIYSFNSDPCLLNNTISFNYAGYLGGGYYGDSSSVSIAINTIFWANNAGYLGNDIFLDVFSSAAITYCNVQDSLWPGLGNISTDPLYRDPLDDDFHLMSIICGDSLDSPCIDAGNPYILDGLLDCSRGLGTFISDMGAYGGSDSISGYIINVPGDYPTIQLAIDESINGDTILVHPGIYSENINFNGHNIVVGSMFMMTGDISYISSTIIDGNDSASTVTFNSGEGPDTRLIGFTIQNGWANHGGGIYCSESDPAISNNIISSNSVNSFGGGILFLESSSIFNNNLVTGNSANQGGGICCMGSNPTMINNVLTGNTGNSSGGGIHCTLESNPAIINTILWADSAPTGIEIDLDNSSTPSVSYSDIQGGWSGYGNIDIDPLFRDPSSGDFHLMSMACGDSADSPCIDAGHPDLVDTLLDCSWGLGGLRSDMGGYGGGELPVTAISDGHLPTPRTFILDQNYPNPFNAYTTIEFTIAEPQNIRLSVYDILGRQVQTLIDEHKQAGTHTITFDASDLSSGVYFYRLQAGDTVESKRMILLK